MAHKDWMRLRKKEIPSYCVDMTGTDGIIHIADGTGMFKKTRPARPQLLRRAERTFEYVSTGQERERRWRTFSTCQ